MSPDLASEPKRLTDGSIRMTQGIALFLSAFLTMLAIGWLSRSKYFGFDDRQVTSTERERLQRTYASTDGWIWGIGMCSLPLLVFLVHKLLVVVHVCVLPDAEPGGYPLYIRPLIWFFPAAFISIFVAALIEHFLLRWYLRERYTELQLYWGLGYGFDSIRVLKFLFALSLPVIIYFSILIPRCYYYFTDSGILISNFHSFDTIEYGYDDVTEITETRSIKGRKGNIIRTRRYRINFGDGYTWEPHKTASTIEEKNEPKLMDYVSTKSGVPIKVHDPYPSK